MTAPLVAALTPRTRLGPALTVQARNLPGAGQYSGPIRLRWPLGAFGG
jgi:hypothetical protein